MVSRGRGAGVSLTHGSDPRIRCGLQQLGRLVGTVVDDNDFEVLKRLCEDAVDCLSKPFSMAAVRDDHAYQRHLAGLLIAAFAKRAPRLTGQVTIRTNSRMISPSRVR